MSRRINIELETVKHLTAQDELALVQAAYDRNPSPAMRWRLASLLVLNDDAKAVTDLLSGRLDLGASEEMTLAQAWLARESAEGDAGARAAADRALALVEHDDERAAALALRAKAETRMGETDTARATLTEALALDPHNKDACKRLATIMLAAGETDAVLALYDDLAAKGAAHARLFTAKALAHARRDEREQVRSVMGADDFFRAAKLSPPPGWDSIEEFNAALAEQLLAHPGLRFDRYGTASELTWRIDSPLSRAAPLVKVLLDHIADAINAHVEAVGGADHPWAAARPSDAILRAWCVITESDGFETWHVHQFGWLSGAYYVRVPDSIARGNSNAGCIAFGLPEDVAGEEAAAAYGTNVVRPQDGLCLMFPSHTYHRTYPHGMRDRRICVAFDLKPRIALADEAEAA
jgi:thioredoxin-like negative regulator of GroEL